MKDQQKIVELKNRLQGRINKLEDEQSELDTKIVRLDDAIFHPSFDMSGDQIQLMRGQRATMVACSQFLRLRINDLNNQLDSIHYEE